MQLVTGPQSVTSDAGLNSNLVSHLPDKTVLPVPVKSYAKFDEGMGVDDMSFIAPEQSLFCFMTQSKYSP